MSIISIPNQPIIIPYIADDCQCGDNQYAQLVNFQDQLFLQVELNCLSDRFNELRAAVNEWSESGSIVCANAQEGGSYVFEVEPDQVYNLFVFTITVTEYTSGILYVNMQGGQEYSITAAGTYTFYFNTDIMLTNLRPRITISGDTFVGCFSRGSLLTGLGVNGIFTDHRFFIIDEDDNVVIDNADYYQVVQNTLTVGFNLDDHSALSGCYRIAYSDACDNVCGQFRVDNGRFTTDSQWTLLAGASISASTNLLTLDKTTATPPRATSETLFCEDREYYVEFSISSISGGSVVAQLGNSSLISGSAVGVFSGTITSTSGTEFSIILTGSTPIDAVVDYVIVRFSDDETPIITATSNTLQVGDYSSCEYVKIEGCCADDSFGFTFNGSNFIPGIRVKRRFFRAVYESEIERYRYSNGDTGISYADVQKVKTLRIEGQPEYVFDFLSLAVWFDSFLVNAQPYVLRSDEFPSIEWNDAYDLGAANLELIPATGLLRKVNCTGNDPSCLPTVFGNDSEPFLLLENGDRLVLEGGDNMYTEG